MDLLTVQETAALLKVSDGTVRRHVAAGRLPAVRVGRLIRIRREAVERFLEPVTSELWVPITADDPLWNIVGIIDDDGPTDMAENHDYYLAEAYMDLHINSNSGPNNEVDAARRDAQGTDGA